MTTCAGARVRGEIDRVGIGGTVRAADATDATDAAELAGAGSTAGAVGAAGPIGVDVVGLPTVVHDPDGVDPALRGVAVGEDRSARATAADPAVIAIALALIGLVVMIITGVAVSSSGDDHLAFLGLGVETTTAQVFLTGAIFAWLFVIALWLLRSGLQRSNARCAQLAVRRARREEARRSSGLGDWLGFGPADSQHAEPVACASVEDTLPDVYAQTWPDAEPPGQWFGLGIGGAGGISGIGGAGGTGPGADDGGPPHRGDGGPDLTHRSVAAARDQAGADAPRYASGPGAGRPDLHGRAGRPGVPGRTGFLGIGVDRRGQGRQIGR